MPKPFCARGLPNSLDTGLSVLHCYLMNASKGLQKLLADFIFRDCRIEAHPKLLASHVWFASDEATLELVASVSKLPLPFDGRKMNINGSISGMAWRRQEAVLVPDVNPQDNLFKAADFMKRAAAQSLITVPIGDRSDRVGALSLISNEKDFFSHEDVGRAQLLGALIAFVHARARKKLANTDAAAHLGRALATVRVELGLTQDELANLGGLNRIALSQWERGRWPPSMGPIYQWCAALGLVSEQDEPQVSFLDVTSQLIVLLGDNPNELRKLSPERFEHVVAERIDRMGYDVQLTGATTQRDGGIDIIATPKIRTVGSFLMAVQVKHHRGNRTTGRPEVDRLLAWKDSHFRVGVMVTNTSFSQDARWLADQVGNKAFLRLRDFEDLKRWLKGQFDSEFDWREIPDLISLAPGITVAVPKGRLRNSRQIWPLSGVNMLDGFPED